MPENCRLRDQPRDLTKRPIAKAAFIPRVESATGVKLDMTSLMSLIVLSIYIIIDRDALWYNTLDDKLSSLNTVYSSCNMVAAN